MEDPPGVSISVRAELAGADGGRGAGTSEGSRGSASAGSRGPGTAAVAGGPALEPQADLPTYQQLLATVER